MHIFNQGKYKNLHAQQPNELAQIRQQVLQDQDYRPCYHMAPETGLLNDPNGLVFDGENYHIFYQWFPYGAMHGMKHWRHLITQDFCHFRCGDTLIPDQLFESHGCYSGGAIVWQDQIVAFYTGNTRNAQNQRIPHQNIAIFDKSGKLKEKRSLLNASPEGYTEHVRDPKPFITQEEKIRFILGAQRTDLSGTALLYEMDNLASSPQLLGELQLDEWQNEQVFMWECPDLLSLKDQMVFLWSPQGKAQQVAQFQNNYHACYALGKIEHNRFNAVHIEELDQGFDFYAPQSFWQGNGMYLAWVGLPDLTYPTDHYCWHSMLTLPRQLHLENGQLYQRPIDKIYHQLKNYQQYVVANKQIIPNLDRTYLKFEVEDQPFQLAFFTNSKGQKLQLSYDNHLLSLDRTLTEQTKEMASWGSVRQCQLDKLNCIEIFFDRSVIEIFLNNGERVMTSRFFIPQRINQIETSRPMNLTCALPTPITIEEEKSI